MPVRGPTARYERKDRLTNSRVAETVLVKAKELAYGEWDGLAAAQGRPASRPGTKGSLRRSKAQ
jgi:hypothetical protein